jgi:hypothetical protein
MERVLSMTITKIYRVSVEISDAVYREFGDSQEYERKSIEATKGSLASGQNAYSEVEVWAEFYNYDEAVQCKKNLLNLNYYFAGKLSKEESDPSRERPRG